MDLPFSGILLTRDIEQGCGPSLEEFEVKLAGNDDVIDKIKTFRAEVENFIKNFPMPGFDNW